MSLRAAAAPVALALLLLCCASPAASTRAGAPAARAAVDALALRFREGGAGTLSVTVQVQGGAVVAARARAVSWLLTLEGRPFASGVSALAVEVPIEALSAVSFEVPLAWRNAVFDPTHRRVRAELTGELELDSRVGVERVSFAALRDLDVDGAPVLEAGGW